jgi:hypothetical protein
MLLALIVHPMQPRRCGYTHALYFTASLYFNTQGQGPLPSKKKNTGMCNNDDAVECNWRKALPLCWRENPKPWQLQVERLLLLLVAPFFLKEEGEKRKLMCLPVMTGVIRDSRTWHIGLELTRGAIWLESPKTDWRWLLHSFSLCVQTRVDSQKVQTVALEI